MPAKPQTANTEDNVTEFPHTILVPYTYLRPGPESTGALADYEGFTPIDDQIASFHSKALEDRTFQDAFTEEVRTLDEFLAFLRDPTRFPVFGFQNLKVIGLGWLDNIAQHKAWGHFCFLKRAQNKLGVGLKTIDMWFSWRDADGQPTIDLLLGLIDVRLTKAIKFTISMGFNTVGTIPRVCDRSTPAILLYLENPNHGR